MYIFCVISLLTVCYYYNTLKLEKNKEVIIMALDILNSHLEAFSFYIGFLGLFSGSFYNVIIYRLPLILEFQELQYANELTGQNIQKKKSLSLFSPRSHCPKCKRAMKPYELTPIFGYLFLKGRCGGCGVKISYEYPLVELGTGILFFLAAWHFGVTPSLFAALIFISSMICLGFIDWHHQILPDKIIFPTLFLGLFFNTNHVFTDIRSALIGLMAGYLSLWFLAYIFEKARHKEGMGEGDMKMAALLGAYFGWESLPNIVLIAVAFFLGTYIIFKVYKKGAPFKDTPLPFGPALAIAGLIFLFFGDTFFLLFSYWASGL